MNYGWKRPAIISLTLNKNSIYDIDIDKDIMRFTNRLILLPRVSMGKEIIFFRSIKDGIDNFPLAWLKAPMFV